MRIAVVGATGNVGTSLLERLAADGTVESVLGVARRRPQLQVDKTEWATANIATDELVPLFRGLDAVVHLAWLIQPSRDLGLLWRVNVEGSTRVFRAVAEAGVPALVYASSVGAYSPGPKDGFVGEDWPVDGTRSSYYARQKAEVERRLDEFEREHTGVRVVRLRPGLIFKREAATGIRRLFAGPFLPGRLVGRETVPIFPDLPGLRFQAVHSLDVAEAYRLALLSDAHGPFNVAAEPVLDSQRLAELFQARLVPLSPVIARRAITAMWHLRLIPIPADWLELALSVPLLDVTRARQALGWTPQRGADEAFRELIRGLRERAGTETPPLSPRTSLPLRIRELATGVGRR
jgi:UDP-glucose 4-epimerase